MRFSVYLCILLLVCARSARAAGEVDAADAPNAADIPPGGDGTPPLSEEDKATLSASDSAIPISGGEHKPDLGHVEDSPYHDDDHEMNDDSEDFDQDQVSQIDESMICHDGNCEVGVDERDRSLLVGAVAYDPKVITFWESVKSYTSGPGRKLELDFVLYSNYDRLVEAMLHGFVHMMWASPMAWIELEAIAASRGLAVEALIMRDSDQDQRSLIVVRSDSSIKTLVDLKGKTVAVGAADSPQSSIIPLFFIKEEAKLSPSDMVVQKHDLLLGKHGDHLAGEREAALGLANNTADASCMAESSYATFIEEGVLSKDNTRVLAYTHKYDHFVFAMLKGYDEFHQKQAYKFKELMLAMDGKSDAFVKSLMEIENVKKWLPGRTTGYEHLKKALEEFGHIKEFLQHHGALMEQHNATEDHPHGNPYYATPPTDHQEASDKDAHESE